MPVAPVGTVIFVPSITNSVAEAAARNYASSRAMSMAHENIPVEVYDNLIKTVHDFMPVMHRYVSLRKRLLGVDELHFYDVYVPLVQTSEKRYSYDEAKQMVLDLKGKLNAIHTGIFAKEDYSEELSEVLIGLGYKQADIKKVLNKVNADLSLEEQVKEALKLMLK